MFKDGICGACLYEEEKGRINWDERKNELNKITEWAKKNSHGYDCVVGVSGGKDSTFQAIYAKERLGLNVLLVNCEPDDITDVGRANINNLIEKGFDCIKLHPNPIHAKKIARRAFFEYGNLIKPLEYCLWASAYIIADKFDIPLIIQGENSALTLGEANTELGMDGDAMNSLGGNTLNGCNAKDWVSEEIHDTDLLMYQFPYNILKKNIKAIYLQYYLKQWSQVYNADFAIARGLRGRDDDLHDIGRYRRHTALDSDLAIASQMVKYYKFGFGFATDEACYDIREGRLTREEAIPLIKEYDGKCSDKYLKQYCDYIDITVEEFWHAMEEKFINKKLFHKDGKGNWLPKFKVGVDFE